MKEGKERHESESVEWRKDERRWNQVAGGLGFKSKCAHFGDPEDFDYMSACHNK